MTTAGRRILIVLAAAQFLMVLDQAVMNVSISQLVTDFHTDVTTIQAVIALFSLVMAVLMIAGGKMGDIWGRRRAFTIGLVIYGLGSLITTFAGSVPVLMLGWSLLEGIGAALVLPALVALTARSFEGAERALAYGVLGGVSGAGIAVGPILGGWMTTNLSWRYVFAGEVALVLAILAAVRLLPAEGGRPGARLDRVGAVLCGTGLALIVIGTLEAGTWGWLAPRNSPVTPFGFSLTPFAIAAGGGILVVFREWERRREAGALEPLVHFRLLAGAVMRSGLSTFLLQNVILMGVFFAIPLYLQVVQGLDAFQTGLRMLPVSIALFCTALGGSRLGERLPARAIVRAGLGLLFAACLIVLATIKPKLAGVPFGIGMAVLGVGMGLIVSQLGNVVQSAIGEQDRSEAGGLQFTAQQLGASLGTALIGAVVISGLLGAFASDVQHDPRISAAAKGLVAVRLEGGGSFVSSTEVRRAANEAKLDEPTTTAIVAGYEEAQLRALKTGLLLAALLVCLAFPATRSLPRELLAGRGPPAATA
jgi:MFS family permease